MAEAIRDVVTARFINYVVYSEIRNNIPLSCPTNTCVVYFAVAMLVRTNQELQRESVVCEPHDDSRLRFLGLTLSRSFVLDSMERAERALNYL